MAPAQRGAIHAEAARLFDLEPIPRCAAESYARLVLGRNDAALFQRILPWDHAAGGLSGFPCAAGRLIIRPPWL